MRHDHAVERGRSRLLRAKHPPDSDRRDRLAGIVLLGALSTAIFMAVGCGGTASTVASRSVTPGSTPSASPSSATAPAAAAALAEFMNAFYVESNGRAYFKISTAGGRSVFWTEAEMIEMAEDACQQSPGNAARKHVVVALMNGFLYYHGSNWTRSIYNDDIMWMVIAAARAYALTGVTRYRDVAKLNFDLAYARSWSTDLGGGLWWTTARTGKNTTTNGPAVIAACELYKVLHDRSFLDKAKRIYAWLRGHLFDARSGLVYDSAVAGAKANSVVVSPLNYTYNWGSFIGAADLLHQATGQVGYYRDALNALRYAQAHLTTHGILKSEGGGLGTNHGGFKGIFARWAVKFTRDNHVSSFAAWFRRNAEVAWKNRNAAGLISQDWSQKTGDVQLFSFDCSSAVVLLEALSSAP
jgi:predicted alpha-1,6-mannanase (GH76 family)